MQMPEPDGDVIARRDEIAAALDRQAAAFGEGAELSLPLALCQRLAGERLPREARAFAAAGAPEVQSGDGRIDEELVMTIHRLRGQNPNPRHLADLALHGVGFSPYSRQEALRLPRPPWGPSPPNRSLARRRITVSTFDLTTRPSVRKHSLTL